MKVTDYDSQMAVVSGVTKEPPPFISGPLTIRGSMTGFTKKSTPKAQSPLGINDIGGGQLSSQPNMNYIVKKVQKRMQLKNMIILKFRNKYSCSTDVEDELNVFIQDKMDDLFA